MVTAEIAGNDTNDRTECSVGLSSENNSCCLLSPLLIRLAKSLEPLIRGDGGGGGGGGGGCDTYSGAQL
uniref:Uncharacterized protein n=1 Tax=Vespula pensylvanica TaxID=30213 RepID=A0A834P743_VESPE|nr:hypothetical protein H0235_004273 [Vespula pensylvanica]